MRLFSNEMGKSEDELSKKFVLISEHISISLHDFYVSTRYSSLTVSACPFMFYSLFFSTFQSISNTDNNAYSSSLIFSFEFVKIVSYKSLAFVLFTKSTNSPMKK